MKFIWIYECKCECLSVLLFYIFVIRHSQWIRRYTYICAIFVGTSYVHCVYYIYICMNGRKNSTNNNKNNNNNRGDSDGDDDNNNNSSTTTTGSGSKNSTTQHYYTLKRAGLTGWLCLSVKYTLREREWMRETEKLGVWASESEWEVSNTRWWRRPRHSTTTISNNHSRALYY